MVFNCPSCGRKLAAVVPMEVATQIVRRTCRGRDCREIWRVTITPIMRRPDLSADEGVFHFIGHRRPAAAAGAIAAEAVAK